MSVTRHPSPAARAAPLSPERRRGPLPPAPPEAQVYRSVADIFAAAMKRYEIRENTDEQT